MFLCCWLALVALIPMTSGTNPGVEVKLTEKGLEYGKCAAHLYSYVEKHRSLQSFIIKFPFILLGRQLGMASIQQKLKTIKVPDISGSQEVSPIGKVKYSLSK